MLELRILSGLQAGARLKLPDGSYSLGHDESCDVVVREHGVEAFALQLAIDGRLITATPGQTGCGTGRGDSRTEAFTLTPGQAFRIADLWLVVDDDGAPWPEVRSWRDAAADMAREPEADDDELDDDDSEDDSTNAVADISQRPRRYRRWLAVGCIATLVGGSALAFAFKPLSQEAPAKPAPQAEAKPPELSTPGMPVPPTLPEPASMSAETSSSSKEPTVEEAMEELKQQLAEVRLDAEIMIAREGNAIRMSGNLDTARTRKLEALLVPFVKKYGDMVAINAQVQSVANHLPFRVNQIISGPMAHIVTDDGERIFVGGSYKGYRLTMVRSNKIAFAGARPVEIEW
jgi:type III secretion protein D